MSGALVVAGIGDFYREGVVEAGREPQFLFLVAFLASFGFIRTSAHLIRAEVSWWPGNVNVGGTHIHHLVWGILVLLIAGYIGVTQDLGSPGKEIVAIAFGIGAGLTLDEFALWLNLRDVYWEKEGRRSIDAVIVTAIVAAIGVTGFQAWVEAADSVAGEVFAVAGAVGGVNLAVAVVNAAKDKYGMALAGALFTPIGLAGAFRLAKPGSLWARRYGDAKRRAAEARFEGDRGLPVWRRAVAFKHR